MEDHDRNKPTVNSPRDCKGSFDALNILDCRSMRYIFVHVLKIAILIGTSRSLFTSYKEVVLPDVSEDIEVGSELRKGICEYNHKCDFVIIDHYGTHLKKIISLNNTTGALKVKSPLDRELLVRLSMCDHEDCVLKFSVVDKLSNRTDGMKLRVLDVNDNRPIFAFDSYEIQISENLPIGYREPLPIAKDDDQGNNSRITYYLFDYNSENSHTFSFSNIFDIVQDPLCLEILGQLDYEERTEYTLRLTAVDNGIPSQSSHIKLSVQIADMNDNYPMCVSEKQSAKISEDAKAGTFVGRISAKDLDSSKFGTLTYAIQVISPSTDGDLFRIDKFDGNIYLVGQLDYEKVKKYILSVKVTEQTVGWFPIICPFEVNVVDVNDNYPRIDISFTEFDFLSDGRKLIAIREDTPVGHTVGEMIIKDADGLKDNSQWEMKFECDALKSIQVDDGSMYILVTVPLDRETKDYYECKVTAIDQSPPYFKTVVEFDVQVEDVNDNVPIVHFPNRIDFNEDTPINSVIAVLNATDADQKSNSYLLFSLSESSQDFKITQEGYLKTLRLFDREMGDKCFHLKINVSDNGDYPLNVESVLKVCVNDVNDNRPTFRFRSYTYTVSEDALVGSIIGRVDADDKDCGDNGRFEFSFCLPTISIFQNNLPFSIEENGTIRLIKPLDYEYVQSYEMEICVKDFGQPKSLTDRARVTFLVQNRNDNCPRFTNDRMVHYINRDVAIADNSYFSFIVEDLDGDQIEISAHLAPYYIQQVKVNLVKSVDKIHQFDLSFEGLQIPRTGYYIVRLIAKDIPSSLDDPSCNSTGFVIIAIGDNSTNRSASVHKATISLQQYSHSNSKKFLNHFNKYPIMYVLSTATLLLFALMIGYAGYNGHLKLFLRQVRSAGSQDPNNSSSYFITSHKHNGINASMICLQNKELANGDSIENECRDSGYESNDVKFAMRQLPRAWVPVEYGYNQSSMFQWKPGSLNNDQVEISL
ncbi:hypothetical protein ACOME3_003824 [Neoechinorhynchus agilis]